MFTYIARELTDDLRFMVLQEIFGECRNSGGSTVVALERYHDKVKERLGL